MMKSAIVALGFAALITPASAADVVPIYNKVPRPVMNWSGCYLGADVGAAWSAQDVTNTPAPGLDQSGVVGTINGAGAIGGGYAGCNLQLTLVWVVGIEGDFSGTHLGGTVDAANLFANGAAAPTGGIGWTSHLDSPALTLAFPNASLARALRRLSADLRQADGVSYLGFGLGEIGQEGRIVQKHVVDHGT